MQYCHNETISLYLRYIPESSVQLNDLNIVLIDTPRYRMGIR
jgi:hypothetical protein